MAKNTAPEAAEEQKVVTKYDRKMEERRKQKEKDKRQERITKITASVIGIALVAAIVISIAVSVITKQTAIRGTYVQIGEHKITGVEYDYNYNSTVSSYLTSYGSILSLYGLDTTVDFDEQEYANGRTWKDMFDEMTVNQIKQMKALVDDAAKNGFTYDSKDEYEEFINTMETQASEQGISVSEYCKMNFGKYATIERIKPYIEESLLAGAYYQELMDQYAPSADEVKAYYEENKTDYDKVDYRSYVFTTGLDAEASEEEVAEAMGQIKADAEAMALARKEGADFNELCLTYAPEESKANYEDEETDYSLSEGRYRSYIADIMADWLFEEGRVTGDITVLEDTANNRYYVVEFINRYYDEADDANISNTMAGTKVSEYIANLTGGYEVVDPKGNLKYLTLAESDTADGTASEDGTASGDETASENEASDAGEESSDESESTAE